MKSRESKMKKSWDMVLGTSNMRRYNGHHSGVGRPGWG